MVVIVILILLRSIQRRRQISERPPRVRPDGFSHATLLTHRTDKKRCKAAAAARIKRNERIADEMQQCDTATTPVCRRPALLKGGTVMDVTSPKAATIAGEAGINRAIATLVLAFSTDPVARWMYREPDQYLLHMPRLFRALGTSSFEAAAAHRSGDGLGVALWLPPGVAGDDGPLEAIIAESIVKSNQADVGAVFERTEHYRPTEPHWYLSLIGVEALHRNKGCGAALLEYGLRQCDREHRAAYLWSSNPQNTSLYQRYGFEIVATIQVGSSPPIFPMLRRAR
jgi:GNAT superfamily N-acetyltransferase